jgi:hypothetical protein
MVAEIEDQREFVRWWRETVRGNQDGNRGKSAAQNGAAEELTGISHQQVSRWRNSLKGLPPSSTHDPGDFGRED